jgi:hypothetical protein
MTPAPSKRPKEDDKATGSGGFLGQVGLFETANGMPHGPLAVIVAIAAAVVIYPLTRLARRLTRR